ncbi:MAG: hypothetical protein EOL97_16130 [Spirochaetia bacterium]|nr:hypothetical protein [Spirochaetia bacterium]
MSNLILDKITTLFHKALTEDYYVKRFGIKKCINCIDYEFGYDLLNLYKRSLERDNCNMCTESYCCTTQIEERINTL